MNRIKSTRKRKIRIEPIQRAVSASGLAVDFVTSAGSSIHLADVSHFDGHASEIPAYCAQSRHTLKIAKVSCCKGGTMVEDDRSDA